MYKGKYIPLYSMYKGKYIPLYSIVRRDILAWQLIFTDPISY